MKGDVFADLEKARVEILKEKAQSGIREFEENYGIQWIPLRFEKPLLETLLVSIERQTSQKVIKTETSSQACPICKSNVNGKYCSGCGQKLSY
ncbi:hypothetical protein OXB_2997 [Bacillus sp. OxB-1]|uniref:hypothetical protein n=1 Tax=Bacillus sp. (strain OxB-1) TaxID=98228 RepID=UPI0005821D4C|nr:hypothetical protein [Bacillus sp. OxB-1]BAQ11467.1 hypothetical protein OXB_2997 [Bacillus sp. OxB-1]